MELLLRHRRRMVMSLVCPHGTVYSLSSTCISSRFATNLPRTGRSPSNAISVDTSGSLGRHLPDQRNINPVAPGATFRNDQSRTRNPQNTTLSTNFPTAGTQQDDSTGAYLRRTFNHYALILAFQHRLAYELQRERPTTSQQGPGRGGFVKAGAVWIRFWNISFCARGPVEANLDAGVHCEFLLYSPIDSGEDHRVRLLESALSVNWQKPWWRGCAN